MTMLETAELIGVDTEIPAFVLEHPISLHSSATVDSAVLRATAHGVFEARIDGEPVSTAVLTPGWSAYRRRLPVERFDVTGMVREGAVIEVLVGNGWWRGKLGFGELAVDYGDHIGFIAELEIMFVDGTRQVIATGADWTARTCEYGPNTLYDGACIDTAAPPRPLEVLTLDIDRDVLIPQSKPPVERQEVRAPERIWTSPSGKSLVDFGQNLVGWTRLRVRGERNSEVVLRHGENLESDELSVHSLGDAKATDHYVLSGGDDVFEPTLTFHGFRFVEITGLAIEDEFTIEAVVVHTRMARTGTFECSDPRVNRLVENSVWSQRGNFLSLPTDCPQREERLGWTGDVSAYAPTACYQFDCADLLHDWLLDLRVETEDVGYVPFIVPNLFNLIPKDELGFFGELFGPTAVWGDAAVWVPEALWWAYGDVDRLAAHYPGIVLHLESILARLSDDGLWEQGFQFGDWLDPIAPSDRPMEAKSDAHVIANACLYRSARFAAMAAETLGNHADAERWSLLAQRTRDAFRRHYLETDGRIRSDGQAVYALAIHFGLLDDDEKLRAGARLAELVRERGHRVGTGFAGTPYVVWALTETGHVDDAYRMLLQDRMPSWLYPIDQGATTIWERWDSARPDGSMNPSGMTSLNHYALGAVADWLYKRVAGISPAAPGYSRLRLEPTPGPGLTWAHGRLETRHGVVESGWRLEPDGALVIQCVVPAGVEADLVLPDGTTRIIGEGEHEVLLPSHAEIPHDRRPAAE